MKTALLGQEIMSGVGNNYADEAILQGGTSFDDLCITVHGESAFFEQSFAVYGQTDRPCLRYGTPIKRIIVGRRSSRHCPRCPRKDR